MSAAAAQAVLQHALSRPPRLGPSRLICIDGPAGSGKTTLAAELVVLHPQATLIHVDDLLIGWSDLPQLPATMTRICRALAAGMPAHHRVYDWERHRIDHVAGIRPRPLVILEGVGTGSPALERWRTTLAWVEAPRDLRWQRWLDRDGDLEPAEQRRWLVTEDAAFVRDRTRARADLHIDGSR